MPHEIDWKDIPISGKSDEKKFRGGKIGQAYWQTKYNKNKKKYVLSYQEFANWHFIESTQKLFHCTNDINMLLWDLDSLIQKTKKHVDIFHIYVDICARNGRPQATIVFDLSEDGKSNFSIKEVKKYPKNEYYNKKVEDLITAFITAYKLLA